MGMEGKEISTTTTTRGEKKQLLQWLPLYTNFLSHVDKDFVRTDAGTAQYLCE